MQEQYNSPTEETDAEYAERVLIPMLQHAERYLREGKLLNASHALLEVHHRAWLKMQVGVSGEVEPWS